MLFVLQFKDITSLFSNYCTKSLVLSRIAGIQGCITPFFNIHLPVQMGGVCFINGCPAIKMAKRALFFCQQCRIAGGQKAGYIEQWYEVKTLHSWIKVKIWPEAIK